MTDVDNAPPPPAPQPEKPDRKILTIASVMAIPLAIGLLAIIGWYFWDKGEVSRMYATCGADAHGVHLGADEQSIRLNIPNDDDNEEQVEALRCIFDKTDAPDSIRFKLGNTRPIDGYQDGTWDGWSMQWALDSEEMSVLVSRD